MKKKGKEESNLVDALLRQLVLHQRVDQAGKVSVQAFVAANQLGLSDKQERNKYATMSLEDTKTEGRESS